MKVANGSYQSLFIRSKSAYISYSYCRLAYITHDDVRKIACFSEDTLLAVKAPFGSTLEVPDPDEGMAPGCRRYEIQLTSRSGPIDVFLIQDNPSTLPPPPPISAPSETSTDPSLIIGNDDVFMKHLVMPGDPYNFEMKGGEGIGDLYGFGDMFGAGFIGVDPSVKLSK